MPVWHASIAHFGRSAPVLLDTEADPETVHAAMAAHARHLLDGVGEPPDHWHKSATVIHLRRRLSDAELALLPPAWLAIPPRDLGGGEDEVWTPPAV